MGTSVGALAPSQRPVPSPVGQFVHFVAVGIVSTANFAVLFALLYGPLGAVAADIVALALCAIVNLEANRRFTFGASGRRGWRHYYLTGLLLALLPLASTLGALAATSAAGVASLPVLIVVLTAANLLASVARFYLLRASVAKDKTGPIASE